MTKVSTSLEIFNSGLGPNVLKFQHIMTQLIEISTINYDQSHSNFNSAFPLLFCSSLNQENLWFLSMLLGGVGLSLVRQKLSARTRSTFNGGKAATCTPPLGDRLRKGLADKQLPWTEDIPRTDIVLTFLWKHKEGKQPRLPIKVVKELKSAYEQ